jgi:RNA processing factor Prp31
MQQQTDDNVTSSDEEGQPTEHRKKKNRQHRRKNTSRTTGGVWMNRADVRMVQMNASQVAEISQLRQDTYLNLMMESKQD